MRDLDKSHSTAWNKATKRPSRRDGLPTSGTPSGFVTRAVNNFRSGSKRQCSDRAELFRLAPKGISQHLDHSHDYVCLNFGSNRAAAVSVRNRGCDVVGCKVQFSRVSGLDFVAKKSSLTISDGRKAR